MTYPELFAAVGLRIAGTYAITAQSWRHTHRHSQSSIETRWRICWFEPGDSEHCQSVEAPTPDAVLAALDAELHSTPLPECDPTGVGELGGIIEVAR